MHGLRASVQRSPREARRVFVSPAHVGMCWCIWQCTQLVRGLQGTTKHDCRKAALARGRYHLHGVAPGTTCNCGVRLAVHQYWRPKLCKASRPLIQGRELGRQGALAPFLTWRSITCKLTGTCTQHKDIRLSSLEQHAAQILVTSEQTPANVDHVVRRARSLVQGLSPAVTPTHTETHSPSLAALR